MGKLSGTVVSQTPLILQETESDLNTSADKLSLTPILLFNTVIAKADSENKNE